MNIILLLPIFLAFLAVFAGVFLWLYPGRTRSKVSPLQQTSVKETSTPPRTSESRAFNSPPMASKPRALNTPPRTSEPTASNSPEGWQRGARNFASPSFPSYELPDHHINTNSSRPRPVHSSYNAQYTDARFQTTTPQNRSIEHYQQCIHASYAPEIDGISLVFTNAIITNAAEVDNVFTVCEQKFKAVMGTRGWERVGWIADLGGYKLVGTEATRLVGEALKLFLDKFGLKTKGGLYLIAHYSSQAAPPDQEQLNEKLKRIQFITAGVINEFQGNVFDTREEAVAFYLRLRRELLAGR